MKIPNVIRLNGVDYTVEFVKNLNDGMHVCHGRFIPETESILLNPDSLGYQEQCRVFLHELFHWIVREYMLLKEDGLLIDDEEKLVDCFSRGMYQILQDNGRKLFDLKENKND